MKFNILFVIVALSNIATACEKSVDAEFGMWKGVGLSSNKEQVLASLGEPIKAILAKYSAAEMCDEYLIYNGFKICIYENEVTWFEADLPTYIKGLDVSNICLSSNGRTDVRLGLSDCFASIMTKDTVILSTRHFCAE